MKRWSLFLLRLSIGLLVFWWGLDKVVAPDHAIGVSNRFYGGMLSHPGLVPILGLAQVVIAGAFVVGFKRGIVDWVVTVLNAGSMLAVWRSVVDPFGHFLEGTNALFFPSLSVFAGCLVLIAFHQEEGVVLDHRGRADAGGGAEPPPAEF
ncbi:MAG: hypothetical protein RQ751_06680 [Longimicrobiales bacterium]|nr:hypothetical protein [Longimicrobiales bacterium]